MTQTGSMGLISAARSRHPRPFEPIIASFATLRNPRVRSRRGVTRDQSLGRDS